MTQSGQGEEPSARPAREGIVLPSDGGEPLLPGMTGGPVGRPATPPAAPPPSAPPGGRSWDTPWGPEQHTPAPPAAQGQPWGAPQGQSWGGEDQQQYQASQQQYGQDAQQQYGQDAQQQYGQYGQQQPYGQDAQQQPYGQPGASAPMPPATGGYGAPMPPADEGATQYIPPVAAYPDEQATRFIPPVPAADEGATQVIPPVGPGALPPETHGESTHALGRARHGAGPMPAASDADPTQFLPPVAAQPGGSEERQPHSDFDNLFRSEGPGPAPATQHLPPYQRQPQGPQQGAYPPPRRPGPHDDGGHGGRRRSRVPLIAAVGVGIVALGIGAGALLAGGGDDDKTDANQPVSATAPAAEESASPSADPAEQQAVALDKLLADSGNSRSAVIKAVADVKSCGNLPQAAQDLRDAAGQRNRLVSDLAKLKVDRLPDHARLTAALNRAWQASASADNHYAAWADQVAGNKKLCKKGQARATDRTQAGNRDSGTASQQKKTAAQLWNTIAREYGLTERQPTQL
ncbi:hypothetical protein [Streptomyces sp. NPDC056628]|uniref:hypothetical protein n=1 Tax=Streptomyces sp. NPDC056628 TaxID=3345882 RepID=UPI0036C40072